MRRFYIAFFSLAALFIGIGGLLVDRVGAHSFGPSLEKEVGEYFFDIGYENDPIVARESTTFALELYNKSDMSPIEFNDIWVRVERGQQTVFATGIGPGFNFQPTMIFTFPEAGEYTLYVRFQGEGMQEIAEASFSLNVIEGEGSFNFVLPFVALTSFMIGSGIVYVILLSMNKRKLSQPDKSNKK